MVASILATIPNSVRFKKYNHSFYVIHPILNFTSGHNKLLLKYTRQGPILPSITGATVYERPVFEPNTILQCQMLTVRMTA